MGLKLKILSFWTPNFVINKMLDKVRIQTTAAFEKLLAVNSPQILNNEGSEETAISRGIDQKRAVVAKQHVKMVDALVASVGREKAVNLGRTALFEVGKELGKEVREMLGVGDNPNDLILAARVLYRVLGIDFRVEWSGGNNAVLVVNRCALASEYSELTCLVLSATDEGVMQGLNPTTQMRFRQYITDGAPACKADILFTGEIQKE